jgi:Mg/Co/Ni transporter MgtE
MLILFAIQWLLFAAVNLLISIDHNYRQNCQRRLKDIGIGAILGCLFLQFVYYGQGFFIQRQFESTFIRVLAVILQSCGVITYIGFACSLIAGIVACCEQYESQNHRLNIITKMKSVPFG